MSGRLSGRRPLTAAQQHLALSTNPISAGDGAVYAGGLAWWFDATPTPISRTYRARIEYRQGDVPQIYIEDPDLTVLAGGRKLPHVYSERPTRLCLYLPRAVEWDDWMRLDETIVPWTFLWLGYFEEWLVSDEWQGGGFHPGDFRRGRPKPPSSQHLGGASRPRAM